ncbi:MAG: sugar ABC transporter permease [Caldilineaceae bacterium]
MASVQEQRLPVYADTSQRRRTRRKRFFSKYVVPWLFIAPILLLHLVVVIGPSLAAFYYSLTDWSGIGPAEFVGLKNFQELIFDDQNYRAALQHNISWLLFFLTVPFTLALVAAALLAQVKRGSMVFRTIMFIPYILPSVIIVSIWRNLLSPRMGVGAQLANWGIPGFDRAFLGETSTALLTIAFIDNWHFWGFLMVLFLAAMQNIPPELYDAAKIDGANRRQEFLYITIPGILPTLSFMLLMTGIWSFLVFDYVWLLTQGGPAGASEVMATYLYKQAFNRFEAGYASAIGLSMSLFAGVIISIFIFLRRRGWDI